MSETRDSIKCSVFAGNNKDYPEWRPKVWALLNSHAPEVFAATTAAIEDLKGNTYDNAVPNETPTDLATRLYNKKLQLANAKTWSMLLSLVEGKTPKGKVALLKVMKHKWNDATGNTRAALDSLDKKYSSTNTKSKDALIKEFYTTKPPPDQKPDEVSAKLEYIKLQLEMFSPPHEISEKDLMRRLVACLPDGDEGALGPYGAAKLALPKRIDTEADLTIETVTEELNAIHKVLYPTM